MRATFEEYEEEDEEDSPASLYTGSASTIGGKGKRYKNKLGFHVSPVDTRCQTHKAYTGIKKLKRNCPACNRLYATMHSPITIQTEEHSFND